MLAGLHLSNERGEPRAPHAQFELTQITGGDVLAPGSSSQFGQEFGQGKVTQLLAEDLNQRLSESYVSAQESYRGAADFPYKKLIAVSQTPRRSSSRRSSRNSHSRRSRRTTSSRRSPPTGVTVVVAPDSPNAEGVKLQIKQLEAAQKAQAAAQTSQR